MLRRKRRKHAGSIDSRSTVSTTAFSTGSSDDPRTESVTDSDPNLTEVYLYSETVSLTDYKKICNEDM